MEAKHYKQRSTYLLTNVTENRDDTVPIIVILFSLAVLISLHVLSLSTCCGNPCCLESCMPASECAVSAASDTCKTGTEPYCAYCYNTKYGGYDDTGENISSAKNVYTWCHSSNAVMVLNMLVVPNVFNTWS